MASPLKLRVDVDMSALLKAARDAGYSVEDLADEFDNVNDASADAARTAQRSLKDIDQDASGASTGVSRVGEAAGEVGGALGDLGGIAEGALAGDTAAAAEGALGALNGLAAAIPGVGGLIAGAIGALVTASLNELDAFGKRTKEIRDETSQALVDIGGAFDQAAIESRIKEIVNDTDKWAAANTIAEATGRPVAEVLAAMAEGGGKLNAVTSEFDTAYADGLNGIGDAATITLGDLRDAQVQLEGLNQGFDDATVKTQAVQDGLRNVGGQAGTTQEALNDYREAIDSIPDKKDTTVKINVDDSAYANWSPPMKYGTVKVAYDPGGPASRFWRDQV